MPRIEESRHCPAYSLPLLVVLLAVVLLVVTLLVSNGHSFCRRGVIHTPHTVEETTAVERSVSTVKREHNIFFFCRDVTTREGLGTLCGEAAQERKGTNR